MLPLYNDAASYAPPQRSSTPVMLTCKIRPAMHAAAAQRRSSTGQSAQPVLPPLCNDGASYALSDAAWRRWGAACDAAPLQRCGELGVPPQRDSKPATCCLHGAGRHAGMCMNSL